VMLARPLPNSVRYPPAVARHAMSSNHPASQGAQCGRPHSDAHADATTPVALAVYQYRRQGEAVPPPRSQALLVQLARAVLGPPEPG
jgi:hypothetical protein